MTKFIFVILAVCLALSGCASQRYGDFVKVEEPSIYSAIASDVAQHLSDKYLIGEDGFQVDPEILGPLGLEIDAVLRERGYAISTVDGLPMTYVFDQVDALSGPIYRLSLTIGNSLHSKAYWANPNGRGLVGSSPWTVRYSDALGVAVLAQGGAQ